MGAYCNTCNEEREFPTILESGMCSFCNGSPRDCDCGVYCPECEDPLEI